MICNCDEPYAGLDLVMNKGLSVDKEGYTEAYGRLGEEEFLTNIFLRCSKCGRSFFNPENTKDPNAESVTIKLNEFPELEITVKRIEKT